MTQYSLTIAILLLPLISGANRSISAEENAPVGMITLHNKLIKTPMWQSFIPLVIDEDQFFVFTESSYAIAPQSEIGIQTSPSEYCWMNLHELIQDGSEIAHNGKRLDTIHSACGVCFFPTLEVEPEEPTAKKVWIYIREHAINLNLTANNLPVPETLSAVSCRRDKVSGKPYLSKTVVTRKSSELSEFMTMHRHKPLYHFQISQTFDSRDMGAALFKDIPTKKEDLSTNFYGVVTFNPGSKDNNQYVMLHPLTILELYRERYLQGPGKR